MPKEYLGFESNRNRIHKQQYGTRTPWTVGGVDYVFPSKLECRWALYLQFLKEHDGLKDWQYQPVKWDFWQFNYRNKPFQYTPDFWVLDNIGNEVYHETKGNIKTNDISRIRRANKHYHAQFWLVMDRIPKKGRGAQVIASAYDKAYINRIVDAGEIFKQMKGLITFP